MAGTMPMAKITPQSIAAAKAYQQRERQQVEAQTGLRISDAPAPWIVHCRTPGCRFASSAKTEGRAIAGIAAHIIAQHFRKVSE